MRCSDSRQAWVETYIACPEPSAVRERRDALGLTRQQIAVLASCSVGHVAVLESSAVAPRRSKVLRRVLAVLDWFEATTNDGPAAHGEPVEKVREGGPHAPD